MKKIFLSHSGIKGQRWGVRRFQNEDGSLTPLGKERYGSTENLERDYITKDALGTKVILENTAKSLGTAATGVDNIGSKKSKTVNNKDYSKLTDEELRSKINRLAMETKYGELTGDTKKIRSGADWTREILQTAGAVVAIGASAAAIAVSILDIKSRTIIPVLDSPKQKT